MGVLGANSKRRQVIFVVDASTALSGIFRHLLTDYIVPCIEYAPVKLSILTNYTSN